MGVVCFWANISTTTRVPHASQNLSFVQKPLVCRAVNKLFIYLFPPNNSPTQWIDTVQSLLRVPPFVTGRSQDQEVRNATLVPTSLEIGTYIRCTFIFHLAQK